MSEDRATLAREELDWIESITEIEVAYLDVVDVAIRRVEASVSSGGKED